MTHAPAPYNIDFAGKPGGNGDLNMYITDKNGRKIAAVWGKRGEKEYTGTLLSLAPDMLMVLKMVSGCDLPPEILRQVDAVIAKTEPKL